MKPTDTFHERSSAFLNWFRTQDGVSLNPKVDLVDLRQNGAGRGVIAREDINAREELFFMPYATVLSPSTSDLKNYLPELKDMESWPAIILTMIYEHGKGGNSKWWPYFQVFPETFDTLMHWSDAERQELRGSAVLEKADKAYIDSFVDEKLLSIVQDQPDLFGSYAVEFKGASARDALMPLVTRMGSIVMAYAFDLPVQEREEDADEDGYVTDNEDDSQKAMVPMADMLNADGQVKHNSMIDPADEGIRMIAVKPIKSGEQCFNDYGPCPRSDLLRRYGYVSNEYKVHDVVELSLSQISKVITTKLGISTDEISRRREADSLGLLKPLNSALQRLVEYEELGSCTVMDDTFDIPSSWESSPNDVVYFDPALLMTVQILAASEQDKDDLKKLDHAPIRPDAKTKDLLLAIVEERLREYLTTIEEDRKLLQRSDLSLRHRQAIEVRLGEKDLLVKAAESLTQDTLSEDTEMDGMGPSRKRRKL